MSKPEIYLDNAATTQIAPQVLEEMKVILENFFGNPSSLHQKGIEAERKLKEAREYLAEVLQVSPYEVIFTSGATESNNLALKGAALALKNKGNHIISSPLEHEAVLEPLKFLQKEGFEVTFLKPDKFGNFQIEDIINQVKKNTILVALMQVNNELGTIYPINEFAKALKSIKRDIIFFSDGVQAFGKIPVSLESIDLYSISAHKIHGPKGIGALIKKENTKLEPQILGGGQEFGLRSGTENVPAIGGFRKAAELAINNLEGNFQKVKKLKEKLIEGMRDIGNIRINSPENSSPYLLNIAFEGVKSEVLLHALEEKGVFVSSGSACSSKQRRYSHVLEALNLPREVIESSLRFSFSRYNNEREIEYAISVLKDILPKLRKIL